MIIATMTDEEISRELNKDLPEVTERTKLRERKFKRLILKANTFPFSAAPIFITTNRRNTWVVIFRAVSRKERKKVCYDHTTFICTARFANGIHAFLNTRGIHEGYNGIGLAVFVPHFFSRYRNRLNLNKTGIDLVADYFSRNRSLNCAFQGKDADGTPLPEKRVFGTSDKGVALGIIKSKSATLFKTFITYDMMHQEQIPDFTQREILRKQEMKRYYSVLNNNNTPVVSTPHKQGILMTAQEEFDMIQVGLKIGGLFNTFASIDQTADHNYDQHLFVKALVHLIFMVIPEDALENMSPQEEIELREVFWELETFFNRILTNIRLNGLRFQIRSESEIETLVQTIIDESTGRNTESNQILLVDYKGVLPVNDLDMVFNKVVGAELRRKISVGI
jgi:hypothetical protein